MWPWFSKSAGYVVKIKCCNVYPIDNRDLKD